MPCRFSNFRLRAVLVVAAWSLGIGYASRGVAAVAAKPGAGAADLPPAAAGTLDYARDIQPILAQHCYKCHGAEKQKSGLRLDRKVDALLGGDSGKVVIPGNSAESVLVHAVAGTDADLLMPPEEEGKRLTRDEIAKLRAWIDAGLPWPEDAVASAAKSTSHWAFKAPERQPPPAVRAGHWVRNPIDAFVLAKLEREQIEPSPEADRPTLLRRLTLDLTGLLPTREEVAAFAHDARPDAYERAVDRLLASPHFGERWGRHWLDLARYADSDGYEKDNARPYAYLFRDWVIDAINRDLPFDEFTIEQLAGDLLVDTSEPKPQSPDLQRLIATGFHRQTLTNREGGVDKEEFRTKATVDRVSTTGTAWLGLTIGCAECHSHKFDPISQREFYSLYSFFNNASEKDIPAPQPSEVAAYAAQLKSWQPKQAELDAALQARTATLAGERLDDWERSLRLPAASWTIVKPAKATLAVGDTDVVVTPGRDNAISPRQRDTTRGRFAVEMAAPKSRVTGFRVEALEELGRPIGRGTDGDFSLSEFRVFAQGQEGEPRRLELASARVDFESQSGPAAHAIDGKPDTAWSIAPQTQRPHVIVVELREPFEGEEGTKLIFELEQSSIGVINRFRLSYTQSPSPLEPSTLPDAVVAILRTPAERRTPKQKSELVRYFVQEVDDEGRTLRNAIAAHTAKKPKAPDTTAAILVAEQRKTRIHIRGDFLRPGDEVKPGVPAVLHAFRARGEQPDRLDLAQWLVDPANPLTARVAVNQVWKNLFGRALVGTVDDFGTRGEPPSHPDLLDWLAVTFASPKSDGGVAGGRKALIKLIVTSATYRQASKPRPELAQRDPNNVLLARQNRFRLEAETIRDIHLAASGLLNPALGGPSIRPPLPADIAALGYANSVKWPETKGADRYRRGLYIFVQRTVPYPMLTTFDAPDSSTTCARRERSNTPLQALTLLNDPVFFECAQALGRRVARESATVDEQIRHAFQLCVARAPTEPELSRLREIRSAHVAMLQKEPANAEKIAGETDAAHLLERAALVALCRVIMNLDEFVTRE